MNYLKIHRYRLGLTQGQFAKKIGYSQGAYSAIEKGKSKPSPEKLPRIADQIGRPVEEVVAKVFRVDISGMGMPGVHA